MQETIKQYIKKAQSVLSKNWKGSYTIPSSSLYPHQWNWDSGFIAIGYSRYDTNRAMLELQSLFNAQWKNGMLPQIVFNKNVLGSYFPEPDFWQTELSPHAPDNYLTSGITMPPIHGYAALKIYENASNKDDAADFLRWMHPRLLAYHRYLYTERSRNGDGLIYIRHPWESGMDNSPSWDRVLEKIDMTGIKLPEYQRKDTQTDVSEDMRPTKKYYDYFVYLLELFKKARYEEETIARECPFLVSGPLFNAILCASNESLVKISRILHEPVHEIEEWNDLTKRSIRERLFNPEHGIFDAINVRTGEHLKFETAAGFIPLFGGAASSEQAGRIYQYLNSKSFCSLHQGNCFTIPSYDTQKVDFKRENYWRGPVWININWMLMNGLRRYGFRQKADSLARNILELPMRFGFYEYYDSLNGRGYGSTHFSWTAALFIDTAHDIYTINGNSGKESKKTVLRNETILNDKETPAEITGIKISQDMLHSIRMLKAKYYSSEGTVNYDFIRTSDEYLTYKRLAASLRGFNLDLLQSDEEKIAFWINLYNTIVVDGIITSNVKESVQEVKGFFSKLCYRINGYSFSPDDIEHGILRANRRKPFRLWRQFGIFNAKRKYALRKLDNRIHFALVCGSRSCAPITYYSPEKIHDELELAAKNFVNSSEVIIMPEEKRMVLSQIFKWYKGDFGGKKGILLFLKKYILDDDKKDFLNKVGTNVRIDYLYYDWHLNK